MSELKRIIIDFLIVFMLRYEGLLLSVGGNGRSYVLILEAGPPADTSQSRMYFSRFSTKVGFCRVHNLFPVCKEPKKEPMVLFGATNPCQSVTLIYILQVQILQLFIFVWIGEDTIFKFPTSESG